MNIKRRQFLNLTANVAAIGTLMTVMPGVSYASLPTDRRFVLVVLRGGMDGLAAVPAYGDKDYKISRGDLALDENQILNLDGYFGLHPSLKVLHRAYQKKQAVIFHAIASPYRERSHFDGQNILENGTDKANGAHDGWLNRAISHVRGDTSKLGLAVGQGVPLVLYGQQSVASWTPANFDVLTDSLIEQLERLYINDPLLHQSLAQGLSIHEMADAAMKDMQGQKKRRKRQNVKAMVEGAGKLLADENGARIATIEIGGWDTHAQQGLATGKLSKMFLSLGEGLDILSRTLEPVWHKTAILVVTEFGRTVAENGTKGSDHGTASAAFLLGGAVKGGQVISNWPGLSKKALYQGRDLKPTLDIRQIFKSVLNQHMGISLNALERDVFPNSQHVKPLKGVILKS